MTQSNSFQPNWVSIPGDTITDLMREKKISLESLAYQIGLDEPNAKNLLFGKTPINESIANILARVLGSSAEFWINRENQYQENVERLRISAEKHWVQALPVGDMVRLGWIKKAQDLVSECLAFFDVPNVWSWRKEYDHVIANTAFRKASKPTQSLASIVAWIRFAEIVSREVKCEKWNQARFIEQLPKMRELISVKDPKVFIPKLRSLCAECGVALVIQRTPEKCPASGATKFISTDKAIILLSFRYLTDDQFWFTFFHEAGHLVLHDGQKVFIESEADDSEAENEANKFSADILIPPAFQQRLRTMQPRQAEIKSLAKEANIPLGIVVGQLQFLKRLNPAHLNGFKRKYDIKDIMEVSH